MSKRPIGINRYCPTVGRITQNGFQKFSITGWIGRPWPPHSYSVYHDSIVITVKLFFFCNAHNFQTVASSAECNCVGDCYSTQRKIGICADCRLQAPLPSPPIMPMKIGEGYTPFTRSSNHQANIDRTEQTSSRRILNAFAGCLLDDCSMFAWSCHFVNGVLFLWHWLCAFFLYPK